ncbi:MAG: hypothetical protein ACOZQL_31900 [Myxococcota bacterium]
MESAERTEPLSLAHPRAATVSVLSSDAGLRVTEITCGTIHLAFTGRAPLGSVSLRVDRSFVTVSVPEVLGLEYLQQALLGAMPEGYLVLAHPSEDALIVTIARAWEEEPQPVVFCTSFDTTLRARKLGTNRLLLRGVARGRGELVLRVDAHELRLRPAAGETPLLVASRVRALLAPTHITLLAVPTTERGDVVLTVLPRR